MEVRQMATVFLAHGGSMLMMKKSRSRWHPAEFWSGIGGHLEPAELNAPREAAVRELFEETGLGESDIAGLTLRYVLLRLKDDEIRQQFVYFGEALTMSVTTSEEGELHWISASEVTGLGVSVVIRRMLEHYFAGAAQDRIHTGILTMHNGVPAMAWSVLTDPGVFF